MTTVTLRRTRIEVGAPRNGKPSYRWTTGYYVTDPNTGNEIHPPVRRAEACTTSPGRWAPPRSS